MNLSITVLESKLIQKIDLEKLLKILPILKKEYPKWDAPAKKFQKGYKRTPFAILLSALISTRTKDEITLLSLQNLLKLADTPEKMLLLSEEEIQKAIYPAGFYKTKAKAILKISKILIEKYNQKVPDKKNELLKLPGVGEKVANIVLESAFKKNVAAVDTHVHRILNLLKIIETKDMKESSKIINEKFPKETLKNLNKILVSFAQSICKPKKPNCQICPIKKYCPKL